MKKLKPQIILKTILLSLLLIVGCDSVNTEDSATFSNNSLDNVLSEIAEIAESEKKIVSFDIVFNKRSNSYSYANVEIIKESKKIIDFVTGADPDYKYMGNSIEVECTDAKGNVTTTTCLDYACVGYAVAACVEDGGCAKVCKAEAKYYPANIE